LSPPLIHRHVELPPSVCPEITFVLHWCQTRKFLLRLERW
jgi:hypothetical protein